MNRRVAAVVLLVLMAVSAYAQTTDFSKLVQTGTLQQVEAALKNGADVKAKYQDGATALMYAAESNSNPEVISTLLKAGADIKAQDVRGWTALMFAAADNQNPIVVTTLIKAGVDIKARSKPWGNTALMLAAMYNKNPEVIIAFLKAGADAKEKDNVNKGYTALDYAQENKALKGTDALKQLEEATK